MSAGDDTAAPWPSPDWPRWLTADSVTIDEAVALSLNRSPTHVRKTLTGGTKWMPVAEFYDPARPWLLGSARSEAAARDLKMPVQHKGVTWEFAAHSPPDGHMRLGELRTAIARGDPRLPLQPGRGERIRLADFVRFACDHGWSLPERFVASRSAVRPPGEQHREALQAAPAAAQLSAPAQDAATRAPAPPMPPKKEREGIGAYRARLISWDVECAALANESGAPRDVHARLRRVRPDLFPGLGQVWKHAWNAYRRGLKP